MFFKLGTFHYFKKITIIFLKLNIFLCLAASHQQTGSGQNSIKTPKRSLSVRHTRKKPFQKHKREGSEPYIPPPPSDSLSGKHFQAQNFTSDNLDSVSELSSQGKKNNRALTTSRENLLTKSFRGAMAQLKVEIRKVSSTLFWDKLSP